MDKYMAEIIMKIWFKGVDVAELLNLKSMVKIGGYSYSFTEV